MSTRYDDQVIEATTGRPSLGNWRDWVGLVARLVLGGSLLVAGLLHVSNLDGNVLSVRAYQLPIPYEMVKVIGYAQPVVEIILGLLIVVGLFTRVTAILGCVAMLVFIAGIASVWARGLSIDCGCFSKGGQTDKPQYLTDILRDSFFLLCGLWLAWRPRSLFSLDAWLFSPVLRHLPTHHDFDDTTDDDEDRLVREDISR